MTRDEKVLKARELRAHGLTSREIGQQLDVNESTVRDWYLGATCRCGKPLTFSSTECVDCRTEPAQRRDRELVARWNQGASIAAIGAEFGLDPLVVNAIAQRRRGEGWEVERRQLPHSETPERYAQIAAWIREGLTNRGIAGRLGTTTGSVSFMITRAREEGYDMPRRDEAAA
jgi:transposase